MKAEAFERRQKHCEAKRQRIDLGHLPFAIGHSTLAPPTTKSQNPKALAADKPDSGSPSHAPAITSAFSLSVHPLQPYFKELPNDYHDCAGL
jgi:hypothetical protein